jgi:hypothetical protein
MNILVDSIRVNNTLGVRLRASASEESTTRPLHIGILLDNSGSMNGDRLISVKRTLHAARPLLTAGDRLTLVTFNSTADILLRAHALDSDAAVVEAYRVIDEIHANDCTNLSAGIEALYSVATNYDAVILLTDGMVNEGVTSTVGLRAMATAGGARTRVFHALGYGADHNRSLLRELAIKSRGTYTFVNSDEVLPIAVGDILSGLRAEIVRGVTLRLPADCAWTCQEVGAIGAREYYVGNLAPERDYWAIFQVEADAAATLEGVVATLEDIDGAHQDVSLDGSTELGEMMLAEQSMRARVSVALDALSTQMESAAATVAPDLTGLRALRAEIEGLSEDVRMRPLMLRLLGQVVEAVEMAERMAAAAPRARALGVRMTAADDLDDPLTTRTTLMARLSSGAACLANQRGVYNMDPTAPPALQSSMSIFSTPSQRVASSTVHTSYTPSRGTAEPMEEID